jgi:exodeoxyribonuclease VII small subunit
VWQKKQGEAMSFEKKIGRLEEIVKKMEGGELSLDDSLKLFEEGVKLSRECNTELSEAEQKVKLLVGVDSEGEPVNQDFPS